MVPNTTLEPTRMNAIGLAESVREFLCFGSAWLSFKALGVTEA